MFWDSSALTRAHSTAEPGHPHARSLLQSRTLHVASVLVRHETVGAFVRRLAKDRVALGRVLAALEDHLDRFVLLKVTDEHLDQAMKLVRKTGLHALDALHLGCALAWSRETGRRDFRFVTSDDEQAAAARGRGLKVIQPVSSKESR